MSASNIVPLAIAGAAAIGAAVVFGSGQGQASSAPKTHQLARRNSEMAFGREGAEIRRAARKEGHSGKGALGDLKQPPPFISHDYLDAPQPQSLEDAVREVMYWYARRAAVVGGAACWALPAVRAAQVKLSVRTDQPDRRQPISAGGRLWDHARQWDSCTRTPPRGLSRTRSDSPRERTNSEER